MRRLIRQGGKQKEKKEKQNPEVRPIGCLRPVGDEINLRLRTPKVSGR